MDYKNKSSFNNSLFYGIVIILYLVFFYLAARNLNENYFWYDESGQFFISQGLNHDSLPYAERGNLKDVFENNLNYNRDPGGYSILLYYWTMLGTNGLWLRSLSYLFMMGAVIFSILLTYKIFKSKKIASIAGYLCFSLQGGSQFYCLRAYSMELCGLIAGLWIIFWIRENISLKKIVISTFILCIFLTSRYTMVMFTAIIASFVLYEIFTYNFDTKNKYFYSFVFGLPLLISVTLIYFFIARIQNGSFEFLNYFDYLPKKHAIIAFFIISLILTLPWKILNKNCKLLLVFYWIANILFLILGIKSYLPWFFQGLKGGPFFWLFEFMTFCVVCNLTLHLFKSHKTTKISWFFLSITIIFCGMVILKNGGSGLRKQNNMYSQNILTMLQTNINGIYVPIGSNPEIRFFFEYGVLSPYAEELGYPDRFNFLTGLPHSSKVNTETQALMENKISNFYSSMPENSIVLAPTIRNGDATFQEKLQFIKPYVYIKMK